MSNFSQPLVSICIPTYNGEKYIEEAVWSALNQTYKNIEIIISDDLSIDNTLGILNKIKDSTKIPFFIHHHQPIGIGANWNNCVRKANGEYIKFLLQDDLLFPECIEAMMDVALMNKKIGLVFSKRNFIYLEKNDFFDEWIKNYGSLHIYWKNLKLINSGKKLLRSCQNLTSSPLNKVGEPSAVLLKKECFNKVGFFNENLVQILDYEFWYRVFKYYKIGFIDEEFASFRLHKDQATQKNLNNDHKDYILYSKLLYKNLFFLLAPRIQKSLFFEHNKFGNLFKKFITKIKIQLNSVMKNS